MHAVRRQGAFALLLLAALSACRGEPSRAGGPAPAPADLPLAWPALDEAALIAAAATEGFALGAPEPLAIAPDGAVLFRRSPARDPSADLYQLPPGGAAAVLASAQALLASGGAPAPRGIETAELSRDGARLLIPLAGRLFVVERASGAPRELAVGPHRDPRLSPDGERVAFVRDGDLWVASTDRNPRATRLTQHPPDREYATPEPAARELGRHDGYWWSPDGKSIAFQRTDAHAVDTLYVTDARHPDQPPEPRKLARPGRPLATVDVGIVSVRGGAPRWVTWDLTRYPYLARVIWPAKGPLTLIVASRDQTQLAVLAVDPAGATGAARTLLTEKDPAWIDLAPERLTWLPDGSGLLWMTESSGAWALELRSADGAVVRTVMTADAGPRRVAGVVLEGPNGPDGRDAILEAAGDPREQHIWRVPLAGGEPTALTDPKAGGFHRALVGHGIVVITSERRAGGRVAQVIPPSGARVELPSVAERPTAAPTTQIESVTVEDHAQFAAITRPRAFDPKVRYPVLLRIAGGPDVTSVLDPVDTYVTDQWYADAGFIVVRTDGRGTPHHDRDWEHAIAGDVLTRPMNDQLGALRRLGAPHPELDLARAGALGTGYGGYLATLGVLLHPDHLAAAIAFAPITDWQLVDAALGERLMKAPATNPEGYRRTAASTYAEQLQRPLLLSTATDTLALAHTLALADALSAAGKHLELATLPPDGAPSLAIARAKLTVDFLRAHLGPPVRPGVMPIARSEEDEEEERARDKNHPGDKDHGDADRGSR